MGYEEEQYSELSYAKQFSDELGVENISNKISAADFFDAPCPISSTLWTNRFRTPLKIRCTSWRKAPRSTWRWFFRGRGPTNCSADIRITWQKTTWADTAEAFRALCAVRSERLREASAFQGGIFSCTAAMGTAGRFSRADYVFENEDRQRYLKDPITGPTPQERSKAYFSMSTDSMR